MQNSVEVYVCFIYLFSLLLQCQSSMHLPYLLYYQETTEALIVLPDISCEN